MENAREGGGALGLKNARMCVCRKVKEMGPFRQQGNEMNEKFSFKMGGRFAASLDKGENFLDILYEVMYKNAGTELQSIRR